MSNAKVVLRTDAEPWSKHQVGTKITSKTSTVRSRVEEMPTHLQGLVRGEDGPELELGGDGDEVMQHRRDSHLTISLLRECH